MNSRLKLSGEQRSALFAGECPKITFPGERPCPVKRGQQIVLSAQVRLEVDDIRRTRKGEWSLRYTVCDQRRDRDRYLVPAGFHTVAMAEDGNPAPMTPEEELGYTTNPARALDRGVPSVSLADQNVLDMQARNRFAEHRERDRAEETVRRDLVELEHEIRDLVKRAAKMGVAPTQVLAPISREIRQQHDRLKDAA